ncbi:Arc family DNA-binding protein [Acinetobacter baumannii]|uniref:Arc family DNA-binding protein n=1 Tax=Acinetobacter baumannii TaxID=470 RepID=UPI0037D8E426|nr:Arc family DNA-binding protein [Acinetobacter baumannii]
MAKDYSQVNFRIPTKLKNEIEMAAAKNERSVTAELVARLEESFNPPMEFKSEDKEMITKIVALSMQTLLETLHNEGVEDEKLTNAVSKIANNKKAP